MRLRLMLGTGLVVTVVLIISLVIIHQSITRMLRKEVRMQLLGSASILAKSSELEPGGVVYEWKQALESGSGTGVSGHFQFSDVRSGNSVGSPALKGASMEPFHGGLNQPVLKSIILPDGQPAMAVGLLHLPFLDAEGLEEMKRLGKVLEPQDFPQILVCARETGSLDDKLGRMRGHLLRAGSATLLAIWLSVWFITNRTLRPIDQLALRLDQRSREDSGPMPAIPDDLPVELTGLADAFNRTLVRVEAARERERQFALHAAHELRTPVAGIQATLEQALSRPREISDLGDRVAVALAITEEMRGTIQSLMRLARLRGGLEAITTGMIDPAAVLREALHAERDRLDAAGLRLDSGMPESTTRVVSDADLLRLLLSILIDNAIRHAPTGSVVRAEMETGTEGISIILSNDADGLAEKDLERIFEPFQRGKVDGEGGAGLGLSLAREIVRLLGGTLDACVQGGRFIATLVLDRR
jgi:signal transduction histidine kinase